ncbi:MAG: hypothetical protein U0359_16480 [Byssovorax sp.]
MRASPPAIEREEAEGVPSSASLQNAVDEAEEDLRHGKHVEHDVMMAKLRRWADGA